MSNETNQPAQEQAWAEPLASQPPEDAARLLSSPIYRALFAVGFTRGDLYARKDVLALVKDS